MTHSHHDHLSFTFGVLGNIASFICFLAPVPTFYRIWKKKSTEGFQSIPYVAALFSAMLWLFYAYVKTGATLLITINAFGCVIETIYLAIYVTYCPRKIRMSTLRTIVMLNLVGFGSVVVLTHVLTKGTESRVKVLGWICVVFATSVFAAPLSIMRTVIRTKSVEFLPFPLSLLLLISAILWLLYGLSLHDIYVTLPNVVGLTFGIIQIVLYAIYRNSKPVQDEKLPTHKGEINNNNENKAPKVADVEKPKETTLHKVDIEIGEKVKEEKQDQKLDDEKKKQDQVANNDHQTELNNNKTGENEN